MVFGGGLCVVCSLRLLHQLLWPQTNGCRWFRLISFVFTASARGSGHLARRHVNANCVCFVEMVDQHVLRTTFINEVVGMSHEFAAMSIVIQFPFTSWKSSFNTHAAQQQQPQLNENKNKNESMNIDIHSKWFSLMEFLGIQHSVPPNYTGYWALIGTVHELQFVCTVARSWSYCFLCRQTIDVDESKWQSWCSIATATSSSFQSNEWTNYLLLLLCPFTDVDFSIDFMEDNRDNDWFISRFIHENYSWFDFSEFSKSKTSQEISKFVILMLPPFQFPIIRELISQINLRLQNRSCSHAWNIHNRIFYTSHALSAHKLATD